MECLIVQGGYTSTQRSKAEARLETLAVSGADNALIR